MKVCVRNEPRELRFLIVSEPEAKGSAGVGEVSQARPTLSPHSAVEGVWAEGREGLPVSVRELLDDAGLVVLVAFLATTH